MGRYNRGTEYTGVPEIAPPGQSIPKTAARGLANAGSGVPVVPADHDKDHDEWTVTDSGVTSNEGGAGIAVKDIHSINAGLQGLGYEFPGTATDINSWTIDWAVPTDYAGNPVLRLFLLATGAGACGGGGGGGVFTGARVSRVGAALIVTSGSETDIDFSTTLFDTDSYFNIGSPTVLTVPTGKGGTFFYGATCQPPITGSGLAVMTLYKNGTAEIGVDSKLMNATITGQLNINGIIQLADGDTLKVTAFQNSGTNQSFTRDGGNTFDFWIGRWDG